MPVEKQENPATEATEVVYHLQKFSGKFGWKVNGTRLCRSSQRKISGSNGTSEKGVLFFRMECSQQKFVFHFFKAIFDTSFRPSRPFSGKCDWFVQMLNAISGTNFTSPELCEPLHTPWTDRFAHVIHGFSPSRVPEFSSSCLARYQVHKNLRHVIKTGVMAVELCRSSVRWLWLFVRQNALFSSWYCWAYRQEWIKVSGQYSAR